MTMTNELLPCPFCAGEPILNHIEPHSHSLMFNGEPIMPDYPGSWTIECCDVGMIKDTREEAIAAWNLRAQVERQAEPTEEMILAGTEAEYITRQQAVRIYRAMREAGSVERQAPEEQEEILRLKADLRTYMNAANEEAKFATELKAECDQLRYALRHLVERIDVWNESVVKITGNPGHAWAGLEDARRLSAAPSAPGREE